MIDDPFYWLEVGTRRRIAYGLSFIGGLGNAAATIANGGYMPVLNLEKVSSLWIPLTEQSKLYWLCDIYFAGSSLGDWFILSGILILIVNFLMETAGKIPIEAQIKSKRLPGLGVG